MVEWLTSEELSALRADFFNPQISQITRITLIRLQFRNITVIKSFVMHVAPLAPFGLSYIRPELMSKAGSKTDRVLSAYSP